MTYPTGLNQRERAKRQRDEPGRRKREGKRGREREEGREGGGGTRDAVSGHRRAVRALGGHRISMSSIREKRGERLRGGTERKGGRGAKQRGHQRASGWLSGGVNTACGSKSETGMISPIS